MDTPEFMLQAEKIIENALSRRYAPQFEPAVFCKTGSGIISNSSGNISIYNKAETLTQPFLKFAYRLPETRIYYSVFQSAQAEVKMVEYFSETVVIINATSATSQFEIICSDATMPLRLITGGHPDKILPERAVLTGEVNYILLYGKNHTELAKVNVLHFLQTAIQNEYKIHPFRQIKCLNAACLTRLDEIWALIPFIDKNGELDSGRLCAGDMYELFWLQEIYLYLGRMAELESFYQNHSLPPFTSIRDDAVRVYEISRARFSAISGITGYRTRIESFRNESDLPVGVYFRHYRDPGAAPDELLHERLQQFWESIHLPIRRRILDERLQLDPDNLIAFALLAIEHDFIWADALFRILQENLTGNRSLLFEMLVLLKRNIGLSFRSDGYNWNIPWDVAVVQGMIHRQTALGLTRTNHGQHLFCELNLGDRQVRVNKNVRFRFNPGENEVRISPVLKMPPLTDPVFRTMQVKIDQLNIELPLVWDDFTIEYQKSRLTFLRKKHQFQITIRRGRELRNLALDGREIILQSSSPQKEYLTIPTSPAQWRLQLCTEQGLRLDSLLVTKTPQRFLGFVINRYGIISEQFRIGLNDQKNTLAISRTKNELLLQKPASGLTLIIRSYSRYCEPGSLRLNMGEPMFHLLRHTPIPRLRQIWHVYLDEETYSENVQVKAVFQKYLGFYPEIRPVSMLEVNREHIIFLIIRDTVPSVIDLKQNGRQTALLPGTTVYAAHVHRGDLDLFLKSLVLEASVGNNI